VVFGSPETTTGGNALKFYCSIRLDIRRIGAVKEGESSIGNQVRVKVVKNKLAPPFREAEFEVLYGKGISVAGELLDIGVAKSIIEKSGAWYALNGTRMGQGRESARQWLEERPKLMEKLRTILLAEMPRVEELGAVDSWNEAPKPTPPAAKVSELVAQAAMNGAAAKAGGKAAAAGR
jgi:recombination protein RecA